MPMHTLHAASSSSSAIAPHDDRRAQGHEGEQEQPPRGAPPRRAGAAEQIDPAEGQEREHAHRCERDRQAAPDLRAQHRRVRAHQRDLAADGLALDRGGALAGDERTVEIVDLAIEVLREVEGRHRREREPGKAREHEDSHVDASGHGGRAP
jgi:hypothetical protein